MNAFIQKYRVSQVLPLLTIIEGIVLDFHLYFRISYGEFLQIYEGIDNEMHLHMIDAVELSPNGNLQDSIHCYSLAIGRILLRE